MSVESKFENKYKNYKVDFIELLDEVEEGSLPVLSEMRAELDEVYAQATKADEYEAKAKAFDRIENLVKTELTSDDLYNDARNNDYAAGMLRVYEIVDYIIEEYESGESNAKK